MKGNAFGENENPHNKHININIYLFCFLRSLFCSINLLTSMTLQPISILVFWLDSQKAVINFGVMVTGNLYAITISLYIFVLMRRFKLDIQLN